MLNFDSNHSFFDKNINLEKGKEILMTVLATGAIVASIMTFSGFSKDVPCNVEGDHAHYYISEQQIGRYIVSEKNQVSGLKRTDDFKYIDKEEKDFYNYLNKNGLFNIEENKDVIENIMESNYDYTEYRYKYTYMQPIPVVHSSENGTYITYNYTPVTKYSWTTDKSKDLTGESRRCHHVYYAYKLNKNEDGNYELIKSKPMDNIIQLMDGYDYIKKDFVSIVNENMEELDYEDGVEKEEISVTDMINELNKTSMQDEYDYTK